MSNEYKTKPQHTNTTQTHKLHNRQQQFAHNKQTHKTTTTTTNTTAKTKKQHETTKEHTNKDNPIHGYRCPVVDTEDPHMDSAAHWWTVRTHTWTVLHCGGS
jgi:hypothetical protein